MSQHQDSATPFNNENVKPVPDSPGLWFYQATRLPVTVVEKDGKLVFQGGQKGEEEMAVADFARLKESEEELSKFGFVKLNSILQDSVASLN